MRFAKLYEDAIAPTRKHSTDAGIDFYAYGDYIIEPNSYKTIKTGITVEIPNRTFGLLKPKGRSNYLIGAGVVDEGYQGEILVKVFNPTLARLVFRNGVPVAQMVIIPIHTASPYEVSLEEIHQEKTERSATGGIVSQTEFEFVDDDFDVYRWTYPDEYQKFLWEAYEKGEI